MEALGPPAQPVASDGAGEHSRQMIADGGESARSAHRHEIDADRPRSSGRAGDPSGRSAARKRLEIERDPPEHLSLASVDSRERIPLRCSALDLDEHDLASVGCPHDQIHFIASVAWTPPVPSDELIPKRPQEPFRGALARIASEAEPIGDAAADGAVKPSPDSARSQRSSEGDECDDWSVVTHR